MLYRRWLLQQDSVGYNGLSVHPLCLNNLTDINAIFAGTPSSEKGRTHSQSNKLLQIAAKMSVLCCQQANTNMELAGLAVAILPFIKLLWCL